MVAVARALAIGMATIVLLGLFGRWSQMADVLNLPAPYWCITGLVAALVLLLRGRRGWLDPGIALVAIACLAPRLAGIVVSEWPMRGPPCAGPGLRLIQFNAWKDNPSVDRAAAWLIATSADVIVLEESLTRPSLTALLRARYPFQADCIGGMNCSTVILSRWRYDASGGLARGDADNRRGLSAAWTKLTIGGRQITVVGVHLDEPWPFPHYAAAERELTGYIATQPRAAMIVAGDFNLPGWTARLPMLVSTLGLRRLDRGLLTWPAQAWPHVLRGPVMGIDHVLGGPDWTVRRIFRGPYVFSDHYPVITDLTLCRPSK